MIVTFDASILVRATKQSTGPARRLIDTLAVHPDHVIALSPFILGEVGKVLSYPRMQALFGLSADDIRSHVDYLSSVSRIVEPQVGLPIVLLDPNDDAVVYTALAAGADVLCVRDRHFYDANVVAFCAREDIRIMNELALLALLG
jgi:putative PIN family toxin of toxin-antitoxin system